MTISQKDRTLATAIPVAMALEAFDKPQDALLAVFILGLAMGADSSSVAKQIVEHGEAILTDEAVVAQWGEFLSSVAMLHETLVRKND